jgi:hypothetical protein
MRHSGIDRGTARGRTGNRSDETVSGTTRGLTALMGPFKQAHRDLTALLRSFEQAHRDLTH